MIFAMTPLERPGRMPRPSTSHLDVNTQILDSESVEGVVVRSKLPCLKPPCKGVTRPCRTNQASRCRASPFLLRPRLARRMSDSYVILGNFVTLWEASRAFPWQRTTGRGHPLTGTRGTWAGPFAPRKVLHDAASPAPKMKRPCTPGRKGRGDRGWECVTNLDRSI